MYISTLYVHKQRFLKNIHFSRHVQKRHEKVSFSTKFYLFYPGRTIIFFFLKRLRKHVGCKDVLAIFSLDFIDIFKCVKTEFQIKRAYTPELGLFVLFIFCICKHLNCCIMQSCIFRPFVALLIQGRALCVPSVSIVVSLNLLVSI
jgi:hypothetical protein